MDLAGARSRCHTSVTAAAAEIAKRLQARRVRLLRATSSSDPDSLPIAIPLRPSSDQLELSVSAVGEMEQDDAAASELKKRKRERAKENKKKRKFLKHQSEEVVPKTNTVTTPLITEDDLLAFQISHFGDDTRPNAWFVDAEVALNFETNWTGAEEDDDGGLGYYDDGVKRTLTDEQIAMFRHSELQRLEAKQAREENDPSMQIDEVDGHGTGSNSMARSPISEASSLESELLGMASFPVAAASSTASQKPHSQPTRNQSTLRRSQSSDSPSALANHRDRQHGIAYDDRNKRKWERHIEKHHPVRGSLTHRRLVRELDEQPKEESVDLDY